MSYNQTFIEPYMNSGDIDFLGLCVSPFTAILGDYFYLFLGMIPVMMMYLKCQDIAIPLISGLMFTAAFGVAFPETLGIPIYMFLGTAIGGMLFKIFKGDK